MFDSPEYDKNLKNWDKDAVWRFVEAFVLKRFAFILALNKADTGPNVAKNILRIFERYGEENAVVCSALSECFLRKMRDQKYINYVEGAGSFTTASDAPGAVNESSSLKVADDRLAARLEKLRNLVLFRHGSTGVHDVIQKAVDAANLIPVFPVKSFVHDQDRPKSPAFPECFLVTRRTTMSQIASMLHGDMEKHLLYAETPEGRLLGEAEEVTPEYSVLRFVGREAVR